MYKKTIGAALSCCMLVCGAHAVYAAEESMKVLISDNSYVMDIDFADLESAEEVNSTGIFVGERSMDLVIVSENTLVRLMSSSGEVVAEKSEDERYAIVPVSPGEEYSIKVSLAQDKGYASVFIYGK